MARRGGAGVPFWDAWHAFGDVCCKQMPSIDGDHRWWTQARRNGGWEPLRDNVLRADGTPDTLEQRAFAGVLDAGRTAFLFGDPALAWFGMRNRRLEPLQIGRRRARSGDGRTCFLWAF